MESGKTRSLSMPYRPIWLPSIESVSWLSDMILSGVRLLEERASVRDCLEEVWSFCLRV